MYMYIYICVCVCIYIYTTYKWKTNMIETTKKTPAELVPQCQILEISPSEHTPPSALHRWSPSLKV